eukprot:4585550-Prymnesium_polylepis.1
MIGVSNCHRVLLLSADASSTRRNRTCDEKTQVLQVLQDGNYFSRTVSPACVTLTPPSRIPRRRGTSEGGSGSVVFSRRNATLTSPSLPSTDSSVRTTDSVLKVAWRGTWGG